jgi:hypothetical protein
LTLPPFIGWSPLLLAVTIQISRARKWSFRFKCASESGKHLVLTEVRILADSTGLGAPYFWQLPYKLVGQENEVSASNVSQSQASI